MNGLKIHWGGPLVTVTTLVLSDLLITREFKGSRRKKKRSFQNRLTTLKESFCRWSASLVISDCHSVKVTFAGNLVTRAASCGSRVLTEADAESVANAAR